MRIIDGDTVEAAGIRYRLAGIDAPEKDQIALDGRGRRFDAGAAAKVELSSYLDYMRAQNWQEKIVYLPGDVDRYGRRLGRIELRHRDGRTLDVCAWMVASGWAVAEYGTQYRQLEDDACRQRRGLWAGTFERPKDWRRARRGQRGRRVYQQDHGERGWLWWTLFVLQVVLKLALIMARTSRRQTSWHRRRRW